MKKVLVIAYLYPPIFNSGTRRSLEFVNHLPDHGWTPIVLTVADPDPKECDPSLLEEVRPGTRIERAQLWSEKIARRIASACSALVDEQRMFEAITWRVHRYWNAPDTAAPWAPLAVAKARQLHQAVSFDAIYATGWPWTSFLVAKKVSRLTGVPFIVDYRDLWQASDAEWDRRTWLQRTLNPMLERSVLRHAAGVIATTTSFLRLLPQDVLPARQFAITNGFDEKDFPPRPGASDQPADAVRVVYTGVWRPGYGPDDLYLAVKRLQAEGFAGLARLKIVTAGFAPGPARGHGIEAYVEELGRVTHAQAIALMSQASAVYLPVSSGLYAAASMPGKLFEYLGTGRPILASAQQESEVAHTLEQVGGARRVDPGDVEALAAALKSLCDGRAGALFSARRADQLAMYTRGNLSKKLALALDAIAAQSPSQRPTSP